MFVIKSPAPMALRHVVQRRRIERRISLADLAAHVRCDCEELASFERGDGVLPEATQHALLRFLELQDAV